LLNFSTGFGNWRVSKTEDIILPTNNLEIKETIDFEIKPLDSK
jgi:hypothetical protein